MSPLDNALDRVLEPVTTARGLPNAHYVDREAFDQEKQAVFFRNWAGVGFGKDVPDLVMPVRSIFSASRCWCCATSKVKSAST